MQSTLYGYKLKYLVNDNHFGKQWMLSLSFSYDFEPLVSDTNKLCLLVHYGVFINDFLEVSFGFVWKLKKSFMPHKTFGLFVCMLFLKVFLEEKKPIDVLLNTP